MGRVYLTHPWRQSHCLLRCRRGGLGLGKGNTLVNPPFYQPGDPKGIKGNRFPKERPACLVPIGRKALIAPDELTAQHHHAQQDQQATADVNRIADVLERSVLGVHFVLLLVVAFGTGQHHEAIIHQPRKQHQGRAIMQVRQVDFPVKRQAIVRQIDKRLRQFEKFLCVFVHRHGVLASRVHGELRKGTRPELSALGQTAVAGGGHQSDHKGAEPRKTGHQRFVPRVAPVGDHEGANEGQHADEHTAPEGRVIEMAERIPLAAVIKNNRPQIKHRRQGKGDHAHNKGQPSLLVLVATLGLQFLRDRIGKGFPDFHGPRPFQ